VGFIVTTLTGTNRAVVHFYNQRGTAEQWIKEGNNGRHAERAHERRRQQGIDTEAARRRHEVH